jgi:hypothetical protein
LRRKEQIQIIGSPDSLYAVLLDSKDLKERSSRVLIPSDRASDATKALLSDQSFKWGSEKLCMPQYGARLIYVKGGATATIDICFECDILRVSGVKEDFDSIRPNLLSLFKRAFPKDRIIRSLKESA